jgi:hypothetical protein
MQAALLWHGARFQLKATAFRLQPQRGRIQGELVGRLELARQMQYPDEPEAKHRRSSTVEAGFMVL